MVRTWPTRMELTLAILFALAMAVTVVLYVLAMLYKVSPAFTVYLTVTTGGGVCLTGMFKTWPTLMRLIFVRLLADAIAETVVLYLLAML